MENATQSGTIFRGGKTRTILRWVLIVLFVATPSYVLFRMQMSMWVFPVHRPLDHEQLVYDKLQKAEESYKNSLGTGVSEPQRNGGLLQANYEVSSAILEKLMLIDQSQTQFRQEVAISCRGLSLGLGAIFLVLVAGLAERLTDFLKAQ